MADRRRLDQPREPGRISLPRYDADAFGKWSEGIARFMGTARFLVYMTVVILAWVAWNTLAPAPLRFDPYTFTFLTLVLSLQASYAAPLILLAQNRQADRDRLTMEEDRRRAAMQKAETEYLSREIASLRHSVGEVATRDFVRSELARLVEELDEAAHRRAKRERKEGKRLTRRDEGPASAAPRMADPSVGEPSIADPSVADQHAGTQEPGAQQPGTQQPSTQEPGTQQPGTQQPGVPVVGVPAADDLAEQAAEHDEDELSEPDPGERPRRRRADRVS